MLASKSVKVTIPPIDKTSELKRKPKVGLGGAIFAASDLLTRTVKKGR
jgi:hypothetical protein